MAQYDVIVVGAGPAGIFTCYELVKNNPNINVLLFEKGQSIYERSCPILENKISKCPSLSQMEEISSCYPNCSITNGFGGAGAYSDGKFNITTEFGGWMTDYLTSAEVLDLIKYVDQLNMEHGARAQVSDPTTSTVKNIEKRGLASGLKLLKAQVKHLGTEQNTQVLKNIYDRLKEKVDIKFKTKVEDLIVEIDSKTGNKAVKGVITSDKNEYHAKKVVLVPGRDGAEWLTRLLRSNGLEVSSNQVDLGVRVETLDMIMEEINHNLYEGKFVYRTSVGTTVRSFCNNPSGHVVIENHSGVMLANGHAYKDKNLGSENTNFALLVSHKFSYPFNKPTAYAKSICQLANDLSDGSVLIQSYGDIMKGRRSTEKRIKECFINPTLKEAVPGNLGLVIPHVTMISIIEMIEALNHVTPGIASDHTLLYGVEAKFYSAKPHLNNNFETKIEGLYAGGDGAGVTRGLAQASACGIAIARHVMHQLD